MTTVSTEAMPGAESSRRLKAFDGANAGVKLHCLRFHLLRISIWAFREHGCGSASKRLRRLDR